MLRIQTIFVVIAIMLCSLSSFAQDNSKEEFDKIDLLFVGDIMGHGPQIRSAYDAKTNTYNYEPCFRFVKPIIEQADLAIGNLEVTLPGKPPYKGYPMFRSPDELATAVKNAGFDVVVTSNNHSNDGGYKGIKHTIKVLKDLNLHQTGTFEHKDFKDIFYPLVVYKNGFKLVFLNYTYDTNGIPTPEPAVVNEIDKDAITQDIADAKELKPDAIIVVMHWGYEYHLKESDKQRDLTAAMYASGADLVIGAHPHVVQPIRKEKFKNAEGKAVETVTAYSLGNFISNQQQPNTDGGIMFEIELKKNKKTKALSIGEYNYIPVWRYIEKLNGKTTFYSVPISAFENTDTDALPLSEASKAKMAKYAKNTRKNLNDNGATERKVTLKDLGLKAKSDVGYQAPTVKKGALPFSYAAGSKMSGMNSTKGASGQTVAYYLSVPVSREQVLASVDTTKPSVETIFEYEPETHSTTEEPEKRINQPPSKKIPKAYFQPKTKKLASKPKIDTTVVPALTDNSTSGNTAKSGETPKYAIQFQAGKNLYSLSKFPFSDVKVEKTSNGFYRYYTGTAGNLAEAQTLLAAVQAEGFPDAFITKYKNLPDLSAYDNTSKSNDDTIYRIQFQTARNYYNIDKKIFQEVIVLESNGWFRYYTGKAGNLADADKLLKIVQGKGFQDAFIVTFENGKPK